jgi:heat shock protein HtpX
MTGREPRAQGLVARVPPLILAALGAALLLAAVASLVEPAPAAVPWWTLAVSIVPSAVLLLGGVALLVDPRPLGVRQAVAAAGLLWLIALGGWLFLLMGGADLPANVVALAGVVVIDAAALLSLAATTPSVAAGPLPGPVGRATAVAVLAIAIAAAAATIVVIAGVILAAWEAITSGTIPPRLPWAAVGLVIVLPVVTFGIATFLTRRAAGGTFHAQAAANRRNSVLLLLTLVAVVAATAEIIAVVLTFDPIPGLWAAGIAALVGLGAAGIATFVGSDIVLQSAGARRADPRRDAVLLDVVSEISLAAGVPKPRVYVIEDGSMNAFATGRDPANAALAVTRGLLQRLDREELQGVIGHELGHVRNLDTRYALYVAILVGLVAIVTDGFLQTVVDGWEKGAFFWTDDDPREAAASFAAGIAMGLFLLAVAAILRVAAPLFSMLVQAAVSREREFLADATSVELTRNPEGLRRALAAIATDTDELGAANRGTQHLWFRNPVKAGSDRRAGLLSTHPSIGARIDRLARLQGIEPAGREASPLDEET